MNTSLFIEIRAAEGGEHSSRLVLEQVDLYKKVASRNKLWLTVTEEREGFCKLRVEGKEAFQIFQKESGGHRWHQKSGSKGKIHSSTVTVAILFGSEDGKIEISSKDLKVETFRASGDGGQHLQKTESAARLTHIPSGISVVCSKERSQHENRKAALEVLATRLANLERERVVGEENSNRKIQIGTGERADKIRTVRTHQGYVKCEITGNKKPLNQYLSGDIGFWNDKRIYLKRASWRTGFGFEVRVAKQPTTKISVRRWKL